MENFRECIRLSVAEDQQNFVASNMYSLAEAKADGVSNPLAIYAGETMVGFIMFCFDKAEAKGYIDRLMVDQRFQGQGYGRFAMTEAIRQLQETPGCQRIQISFHPENQAAEGLYYSLGFRRNGEMVEGEVVMMLELEEGA